MNTNKVLNICCFAFCLLISHVAYANDNVKQPVLRFEETHDPQAEKGSLNPLQSIVPSNEDLLRKQKLNANKSEIIANTLPQAGVNADVLSNARALEKWFAYQLATGNKTHLAKLSELYQKVEDRDESLIEWAEAALLAEKDLAKSIRAYRTLAAKFPENDFIRFQLATTLFYNQEFDAAQEQFQKLRASSNSSQEDIAVFDQFLDRIASKNKWNFSFGLQYLNDQNITDSADVGTTMVLPSGGILVQETPKETGRGINYNIGVNKQWSLNKGKFVELDTNINHKYYWDNKKFNELQAFAGVAVGHADARLKLQVQPYVTQRWYAGGSSETGTKLKPYTQSIGTSFMGSYWLKPSVKYTANYNVSYEKYRDQRLGERYDGSSQTLSNTIMWLPSPRQFWGAGIDFTKRDAKNDVSSYYRNNVRAFWGQEWPKGFATRVNTSIAKRNYREGNFLGKQKNTEYNTSVSLWHKAVHFKGFTPRLTFNYQKTKSNIPLYSFDKKQLFLEVDKTF